MITKRTKYSVSLVLMLLAFFLGLGEGWAQVQGPNPNVNYNVPNYANSPLPTVVGGVVTPGTGMRKFVDRLPGLGAGNANLLGQFIPVAVASTPPGSPSWAATDDYYEIALVEYVEQMHSDLPPVVGGKIGGTGGTKLRGYVQEINGTPVTDPHYLGPLIMATKNRPVRIKFTNRLPIGPAGNLFIPTDVTMMGAGPYVVDLDPLNPGATKSGNFSQNRAVIHLHGGNTPWISDGTAHQWITPAGEPTNYPKGMSVQNVPDMDIPADGSVTLYYTNQQSGRLMFYHDHAYGITRLNVYAGEAAGYLLVDPAERALTGGSVQGIPAMADVPIIIQDKTFVPDSAQLAATDPSWDTVNWGGKGNLWFPHVYVPNQWPANPDNSGASPYGRWDYGPWFWPVFPAPNNLPALSSVPESFLDTPVINGTAYPYMDAPAGPVRLRILNASNDRYWNLQLYQTTNIVSGVTFTPGSGYTAAPIVTFTNAAGDTTGKGATAIATVDLTPGSQTLGQVTGISMMTVGSGYTAAPTVTITPAPGDLTGTGATATAALYTGTTEVGMIPYDPPQTNWPANWGKADARDGGVPDPALRGPAMIQIGTEGGILPYPAVILNTPINYDYDRRSVTVLNVLEHGLFLGPAERADVIVDFAPFAGKTLILYSDSPAPVPAGDPRQDYYTAGPDWTANGGAPTTQAGYGPNTRTIMKINVAPGAGAPTPDYVNPAILAALQTALPAAYALTQDRPIVAESAYNPAFGTAWTDQYARIFTGSATQPTFDFTDGNSQPASYTPEPKAIQELFDTYGRMNSTLGVELPATSALIQTTIPLGFVDPPTEIFNDGETQVWKITHNGVDTHAVHFHLVNVQLINRVGWDGMIKPPDPNEQGWKETIRMNPLEDIIVAMKAKSQTIPFAVPDSIRPMDVATPIGSMMNFTQVDPATGNPKVVANAMYNYGWEYVWHCHLLGHEENDMMRPLVMKVGQAGPIAGVAPTSLTFANQQIGVVSAAQVVTLSNTGTGPLNISGITITGANPADFARTTTCGTSLAAPAAPATSTSCTISVTFRPTVVGARAANLTISSNDTARPTLTVALTGTGLATAAAVLAPPSIAFGNQAVATTSAAQAVTLTNNGTAALTVGIAIGGANAADFAQTTTCGASLAAGANCAINLTFRPTATGARAATVTVTTNDPLHPTLTTTLGGTGTAAVAVVSPLSLAFGNQVVGTASAGQMVTLSNTGNATLGITSITMTGTNPADFQELNGCGTLLAAGASCSAFVTFQPTAGGARAASLTFATNDPFNGAPLGTFQVSLTGTGTGLRVTPAALTFANQLINTNSPTQAVLVTNLGATRLTGITTSFTAVAGFSVASSNCGAGVAPGATCTINVRFRPTAVGPMAANLTVASSDPAGPQTVQLSGTGVGPAMTLAPASVPFGAWPVAGGATPAQAVTVSNTGTAPLIITGISLSGGNTGQFARANVNCPIRGTGLAAGASCTVNVTFNPSTVGNKTTNLRVTVAAPATAQSIPLTGTGQ